MTRDALAALLGITPQQVSNLAKKGMPRERVGNRHDYGADAVDWYYRETKPGQQNPKGASDRQDDPKARRDLAQAQLAELKLAHQQGRTLFIEEVTEQIVRPLAERMGQAFKAVPGKWAPRIMSPFKRPQAQAILEEMVGDTLEELIRWVDEWESEHGIAVADERHGRQRRRRKAGGIKKGRKRRRKRTTT